MVLTAAHAGQLKAGGAKGRVDEEICRRDRPTVVGKIMPTDPLVHSPFARVASPPDVDADAQLPDRYRTPNAKRRTPT